MPICQLENYATLKNVGKIISENKLQVKKVNHNCFILFKVISYFEILFWNKAGKINKN